MGSKRYCPVATARVTELEELTPGSGGSAVCERAATAVAAATAYRQCEDSKCQECAECAHIDSSAIRDRPLVVRAGRSSHKGGRDKTCSQHAHSNILDSTMQERGRRNLGTDLAGEEVQERLRLR
jgi:hypothetical protein